VPRAFYLSPEFEYVGSAPRKLGLVLAFIVAGASGIPVFIADSGPDADPMTAMALAPVETLSIAMNGAPAAPAQLPAAQAAFAQNLSKTGGKPLCQQNIAQDFSDCTQGNAHKPRSVENVKERPTIATVQVVGPILLPSESTTPIVVTPDGPDGSAKRADAKPATDAAPASAVVESPTPADVKKVRPRSGHVQRRDRNAYSPSPRYSYRNYYQNGYARVW
jgi:hypothetical protein